MSSYNEMLMMQLAADAQTHGLVLIVGSGINGDLAPQWSKLTGEMLKQTLDRAEIEDERVAEYREELKAWCEKEFDSYALASIAKQMLGPDQYRLEIQNAIYQKIPYLNDLTVYCERPDPVGRSDPVKRGKFELLRVVAELCQLEEVKAVATFNFDTLLERAIQCCGQEKRKGKVPRSHSGEGWILGEEPSSNGKTVIPVYHVHGILPPPNTTIKSPDAGVVMSYDEYFNRNANPLSWETSSLIHLLRHYCVLWIGVSLKDWNMLRLLDAARNQWGSLRSYCVQTIPSEVYKTYEKWLACKIIDEPNEQTEKRSPPSHPESLNGVAMRFRAELFSAVGVQLISGGRHYSDIPPTIQQIQEAVRSIRKTSKEREDYEQ